MGNILNSDRWHSDDWIKNVKEFLKPTVDKIHKEYWRRENARPTHITMKKKYEMSSKGRSARNRANFIRRLRVQHFVLSFEERRKIRQFYLDCPKGMHVDHIIPIAKGGAHGLANLQWLDPKINQRKHVTCHSKFSEFPQCLVDRQKYI